MSPEAPLRTWMPAIHAGMTVFSEFCAVTGYSLARAKPQLKESLRFIF